VRRDSSLNSSELIDYKARSERIRRLYGELDSNRANQGGDQIPESILSSHALSVPAMLCFKAATAGSAFSNPRLGRRATISPALVVGAGMNIGGGTYERIPLRVAKYYPLSAVKHVVRHNDASESGFYDHTVRMNI